MWGGVGGLVVGFLGWWACGVVRWPEAFVLTIDETLEDDEQLLEGYGFDQDAKSAEVEQVTEQAVCLSLTERGVAKHDHRGPIGQASHEFHEPEFAVRLEAGLCCGPRGRQIDDRGMEFHFFCQADGFLGRPCDEGGYALRLQESAKLVGPVGLGLGARAILGQQHVEPGPPSTATGVGRVLAMMRIHVSILQ